MLYSSAGFRPTSDEYRDNFDRIFRKAKEEREARSKERRKCYLCFGKGECSAGQHKFECPDCGGSGEAK
jgi:DnaJ-class molecular chaperone